MPISVEEFLSRGLATSKEIQSATQLNQTAVARQLRALDGRIIKIKKSRTPYYALTKNAFGGDDSLPLTSVDAYGNTDLIAVIRPLAHGGFFLQTVPRTPSILLGEQGNGLYDDLPWFLYDLSPQGFLGRQVAAKISEQNPSFPTDPRKWNTDHIGRYLVSNGDDLSGNFKFGQQAHLRLRQQPQAITENDYPVLADSVIKGILPGSSAGGEQPKFTAYNFQRQAHVIVKFSPKGNDAIARRWRDILITEHHANEAIHAQNFPAAETRLVEQEDRLFLESLRFDRSGEYGRMSMVSLQAIDAEFAGNGGDWSEVVKILFQKGLVSRPHLYDTVTLWNFGRLIHNTDMHLGNLSFGIDGNIFRLLPIYDMCSMGFSPKANEVMTYHFEVPEIRNIDVDGHPLLNNTSLHQIKVMANDFWERVANDPRISDELREFLYKGNPVKVSKLL